MALGTLEVVKSFEFRVWVGQHFRSRLWSEVSEFQNLRA